MSSVAPSLDLESLRAWIGRRETQCGDVTPELVRRFYATFDLQDDPPQAGERAPPLIHYCVAQPATATDLLGRDGHAKVGNFLPPVPLPRRMWAGSALRFDGPLLVGEVLRRSSRIADVTVKNGRSGPLCFVAIEHTIEQNGRVLVVERQDIVYCSPGGSGPRREGAAGAAARYRRRVEPTPTLLFRYSALTFNSHRIHYDQGYATGIEGYPGLVVHGPLQATLLIHLATEVHGSPPVRFRFRAHSPLFLEEPFLTCGDKDAEGLKLWTARPNGPVAMEAQAEWS